MHKDITKLIDIAYSDGVLTDREKELIMIKAKELGLDEIEVELYISNYTPDSAQKTDNYDITDEELLNRIKKYLKYISESTAEITVEPFPMVISDDNKLSKTISTGRNFIAANISGDSISNALSNAGKLAPIPGGKLGGKLIGRGINSLAKKAIGVETKKLNQADIIELLESYLSILDFRKNKSELLMQTLNDAHQKIKTAKQSPAKKKRTVRLEIFSNKEQKPRPSAGFFISKIILQRIRGL